MNDIKVNELFTKLDKTIDKLSRFSPNSLSLVGNNPTSLITKDSTFESLSSSELMLVHAKLHMFYSNKNGKGLTRKDIENLHKNVVSFLPNHQSFDKLDR